jgi:hypothetical protein
MASCHGYASRRDGGARASARFARLRPALAASAGGRSARRLGLLAYRGQLGPGCVQVALGPLCPLSLLVAQPVLAADGDGAFGGRCRIGRQQPEQRLAMDALAGPGLADQAGYLAAAYSRLTPRIARMARPPRRNVTVRFSTLATAYMVPGWGGRVSRVVTSASSAGGRPVPGSRACRR